MSPAPFFLSAFTIALCPLTILSAAEIPEGFRPIFDGESLDGWHGRPHFSPQKLAELSEEERAAKFEEWNADARKHWSIDDGELVNDGRGAYLVTNEQFGDYELVLEYKTVLRADSGIYLKGTPQVQIWDYTDPGKFRNDAHLGSGGLWNNSPGSPGKNPFVLADRRFGEWNHFRIRQVGARTSVWLNDQLVVDHAIMENYWDRKAPLPLKGPIELQTHGGEIRWRNLAVRELTPEEANAVLAGHQEQAFTLIFNGKDLSGWQNQADGYEVVDGNIQCKQKGTGNLLTEKEYENFVVRLEFKLPPAGNNGLAIRSPGEGDVAYAGMCELQILDSEHERYANLDQRQYHGSAYGMAAARRGYLRETGEWNFQEVTVDGSTIKVELNGNVILTTDLSRITEFLAERPHPGKDRTRGYFGFAGHGNPVQFRNISMKVLPPTPKTDPESAQETAGTETSKETKSAGKQPGTQESQEVATRKPAVSAAEEKAETPQE